MSEADRKTVSRLQKDGGQKHGSTSKRSGSQAYTIEELVAELGSAFLCADLGLALELREDHAAYIANWFEILKNDKHAIFTAASHAQRAAAPFRTNGHLQTLPPLVITTA